MPVEDDDVLFPLVLLCSISRLQLITEKPRGTAQREQKLGTVDVEDEKAACAVPSARTLDYDMARARAIRYDWPSIWALAVLKSFFDHANQRILGSNKQTRLFFLPFFQRSSYVFRNMEAQCGTTSETKHNLSNATRHWYS